MTLEEAKAALGACRSEIDGIDRRLVALRGLAAMIDGLRARGFGFATVSDLVATRADTSDPALASRGPARW